MGIVKITIATDVRLIDALSDFLVGVLDAAVECGVETITTPTATVQGFLSISPTTGPTVGDIERQVAAYAAEVAAIFGVAAPSVNCEVIAKQDWSTSWKEYFHAFAIVPGLVIAPSWEPYHRIGSEQVIVMDPGMAFGTGQHATTRLCLELLRRAIDRFPESTVLDVGTGTGILAMAAALFGAVSVTAIDNDPDAVFAALDNVGGNNLEDKVTVSGISIIGIRGSYRIVVANIVHDTIMALAVDLERLCDKGAELILSGLICGEQVDSVVRRFSGLSFRLDRQLEDGEWCAVSLIKM